MSGQHAAAAAIWSAIVDRIERLHDASAALNRSSSDVELLAREIAALAAAVALLNASDVRP
ncbi:MAG: hypothetical protein GC206_16420 [Alphaproteobacteria bacterium]|nr:hypothetical protein [Alphaproteobacteria bacterium]